jgi:3-methyladenine DNA glycosylase AlkD
MSLSEIVNEIVIDLGKYADKSRRESAAINHPTSMQVIGLKVPDQRIVIENWRKRLGHFTEIEWIELSIALVETGILEAQQVAYELIWKNKQALHALTSDHIFLLGKNLDNWVSVDMFCLCISGYCWRIGTLQDENIINWAKSNDRWLRRTALVSTVPLNLRSRKGTGQVDKTLAICKILTNDRDDMVVKAMSWALRELSKFDQAAVRIFISDNVNQLHSRVLREVNTKLTTGKKNG